jgi:hypothetical protein
MCHVQQQQFATTHGKLGLALFVIMTLQLFSGNLRGMGIANRGNKFFGTNYDRLHQVRCVYAYVLTVLPCELICYCSVCSAARCLSGC